MSKEKEAPVVITNLQNITIGKLYSFEGVIRKIIFPGDKEKNRPLKFLAEFEQSNQKIVITDWDSGDKDIIEELLNKGLVVNITFKAKDAKYKDEALRYDLDTYESTDKVTSKPADEEVENLDQETQQTADISDKKQEIQAIINSVKNEKYKSILNWLIIGNDNFFIWPAAYNIHHAFEGGLYVHTIGVYENAVSLARHYMSRTAIDMDLIITGSLLHDIGKLVEYNQDGSYTLIGNMLSHLVVGVEMIDDACYQLNINNYDMDIIKLKHIIASHHGELQYGSPNEPVITEAYIINAADREDAKLETVAETLVTMTDGTASKMKGSGKIIKI